MPTWYVFLSIVLLWWSDSFSCLDGFWFRCVFY
jgi:hypothetical protein